jgi:hypothetical protein
MVSAAFAQQTAKQAKAAEKAAAIKSKIESKAYVFKAEYAQPLRGIQKYLTPEYDLRINPDSAIAFLPYFGRGYMSAPLTPEESGIMFTSTKFDYQIQPKKKGGWKITITPANVKFISKMQLDISSNGSASLLVSSNYRDQITFTGYIKE